MPQTTKAKVTDVQSAMEERLRGQEGAELWVVDTRLGKILVGVVRERVWLGLSGIRDRVMKEPRREPSACE